MDANGKTSKTGEISMTENKSGEVVLTIPGEEKEAKHATFGAPRDAKPRGVPESPHRKSVDSYPENAYFMPSPNRPPKIPNPETLTRRKTLARSIYSKPKSRFGEQPLIDHNMFDEMHEPVGQTSNSPMRISARASPRVAGNTTTASPAATPRTLSITPKTPLMASPGAAGGDESDNEEEIYKKVNIRKQLKLKRVKLKVLFQWVVLLFLVGCIVASLMIPKLKNYKIWSLELWKWFVLITVIICGMLVTNWLMHFIVLLIELNFLLRKKVLYFVHGLKKSVQVCIWLIVVLVTWTSLFNSKHVGRSKNAAKVLDYLTWTIVALLVGSILWLVKTFLLKILATSFHVSNFFDRIQESIFLQYVLHTLSGPPVMESLQNVGASTSKSQFSLQVKKNGKDKKTKKEVIDVSKLHQMKREKVSAWTMKMLVDTISNSGLSTFSGELEESAYYGEGIGSADKEITSEMEAIAAAYHIFRNVAQPGFTYIEDIDLRRFMIKEEVDIVFPMIDVAEKGQIDRKTLTEWVVKVYFKTRNVAPGFGIGALEELDAEDEDVYASGYDFEAFVEEIEEPTKLAIEDKKKTTVKQHGILPGFKSATNSDYQLERFDPPVVPKDFVPRHKFPATSEVNHKMTELPPKDVPPPEDNNLKILIEGVATLVARCGPLFEELSREKNQSNPLFDFLNGGNGHDYYKRKLWEAKQKHGDKIKPLLKEKATPNTQKMTAESRGNILGEKPLVRSVAKDVPAPVSVTETVNLQFHLSDTFTEPSSFVEPTEITKPFQHDPAKQDRFEQYMKEKYHGGLRTKDAGGSSKMSESARARERLEFEAAAEAITQGKWGKESQPSGQQILDVPGGRGLQFTSGGSEKMEVSRGEETIEKSMFPKREEFQWRPASILCKRFDLIDPYMGKPPPPPRSRSKLDSLIFMPDYVKAATEVEKTFSNNKLKLSVSQLDEKGETSVEDVVEVENVERPVDLYKAIFSDDSDDEEGSSNIIINQPQSEDPTKKIEAANTTLSRLVAGDFLESLGKELGLEVPPENHVNVKPPQPTQKSTPQKQEPINSDSHKDIQENSSKNNASELNHEKRDTKVERKGSSSEDDRKRKRSRRHRNRNRSSSDGNASESSDDYRDRDRHSSRRKERKKESSRDRSSSHGRHRKHRSRDSSSKSRRYEDKDYGDGKREKRKSRD